MNNITSDPNLWVICILIFFLGLLIGVFLTAGGRRKWKTRYSTEVERRREIEREHERHVKDTAEREKEWRERDSPAHRRDQGPARARRRRSPGALTFDLREIGDAIYRVAEAGQQVQPPLALGGIRIIDRHMVEEGVDRRAQ